MVSSNLMHYWYTIGFILIVTHAFMSLFVWLRSLDLYCANFLSLRRFWLSLKNCLCFHSRQVSQAFSISFFFYVISSFISSFVTTKQCRTNHSFSDITLPLVFYVSCCQFSKFLQAHIHLHFCNLMTCFFQFGRLFCNLYASFLQCNRLVFPRIFYQPYLHSKKTIGCSQVKLSHPNGCVKVINDLFRAKEWRHTKSVWRHSIQSHL